MNLLRLVNGLKGLLRRHKALVLLAFISWTLWFFGLGALGGYFLSKGGLGRFPPITSEDRILILAPHIDDEVISSGGVIQEAVYRSAGVKVVYLTNGDDSFGSVISETKRLDLLPNEFVRLGEKRMEEGRAAARALGLNGENLIFLGYPDQGLDPMLTKHFNESSPYTSPGTKFKFNPYQGTYRSKQLYIGSNVLADLGEIIDQFKPTIILVPHSRDRHPDHRATFQFLDKIFTEHAVASRRFAYLVHYPLFPPEKRLSSDEFLYPPRRLFAPKGWYSFDLSAEQESKKLEAVGQNTSQLGFGSLYGLIQSFVKRNEIFEEIE